MPTHLIRETLLMIAAAALLAWTASREAICFADGLRYIHQAREIDAGDAFAGLFRSIDHPAYPLAIAAAHRAIGGTTPESWQKAAQAASVVAGVLLVVPLYLIALEMFGSAAAWLAVVLTYMVPLTGHVLADTLSEGWFLLFFSMGVWTSLRFLRDGKFPWLLPSVGFAALAYWVRPEGLLLPAAMVATLAAIPLIRSTRLHWPRWWAAVAFLVIGPACLMAPIVASKGGISTKPAVGRFFGTLPKSAADAVERQRPLDADQSEARTYVQAARAMAIAVRDAVTPPLLVLALLGFAFAWPPGDRGRSWVFLAIVMVAWSLALIRLHATGGYCTPRHAMILAFPLIASAASGFVGLVGRLAIPGRWVGQPAGERFTVGPIAWVAALLGFFALERAELAAPLNDRFVGYRDAARYLDRNVPDGEKVVDVTGWALFYGGKPGYTFANLVEAEGDRSVRRVVVRDAHLTGPWTYCERIRRIVGDRKPVATYPERPVGKQSVVFVYDWSDRAVAGLVPDAGRR